jgi:epoxyqueuosine reductase
VPEPSVEPAILAARAQALALSLGFDRAGIASLGAPTPEAESLRAWIASGRHGEMDWLARRVDERIDPRLRFAWARTAIVVGIVYDTPAGRSAGETDARPAPPAAGRVARYAGGDDYHDVLLAPLRALGDALEPLAGRPVQTRAYVDTGPLLERALAAQAGIGWIGRNTCLIDPELGSYLFLGVLLTDLELPAGPPQPDHCGSCRACLDACPTDTFPAPYVLDATRCLSYTTIELRGEIPEPLRAAQGDWVFGCDVCQEVCPWNLRTRRAVPSDPLGLRARIAPRPDWVGPSLAWLLSLDEDAWRGVTRRTALRRTKRRGLLRNALIAAGNAGDLGLAGLIDGHAASPDPVIAEAARWALDRLAPSSLATSDADS